MVLKVGRKNVYATDIISRFIERAHEMTFYMKIIFNHVVVPCVDSTFRQGENDWDENKLISAAIVQFDLHSIPIRYVCEVSVTTILF